MILMQDQVPVDSKLTINQEVHNNNLVKVSHLDRQIEDSSLVQWTNQVDNSNTNLIQVLLGLPLLLVKVNLERLR